MISREEMLEKLKTTKDTFVKYYELGQREGIEENHITLLKDLLDRCFEDIDELRRSVREYYDLETKLVSYLTLPKSNSYKDVLLNNCSKARERIRYSQGIFYNQLKIDPYVTEDYDEIIHYIECVIYYVEEMKLYYPNK